MATSFTTMRPFWSPSDAIRSLAGNPGRPCTTFQENAGTINAGTTPGAANPDPVLADGQSMYSFHLIICRSLVETVACTLG